MAKRKWQGDYYDHNGQRRRKSFSTKAAAEAWEATGKAVKEAIKADASRKIAERKRARAA
jgi:hypothetical protein